jgi:hypothetical protein
MKGYVTTTTLFSGAGKVTRPITRATHRSTAGLSIVELATAEPTTMPRWSTTNLTATRPARSGRRLSST